MHLELTKFATTAVSCGGRVGGLLMCSPVLSSVAVSAPVKAALALGVAVLVYPAYTANALPGRSESLLTGTVTEFAIGAAIGLAAQLVFEAVQLAGQTMGLQMGFSLATVFDPTSNADSPALATMTQMLATLIFLALNAHVFLLRVVADSYRWLPPGAQLRWATLAEWGTQAVGGVLSAGVQLAAPVLLATICVDLVLGLIGKASPQLPVLLIGISVKAMVGLGVLLVSLRFWPDLISRQLETAIGTAERFLQVMR